MIKSLDHKESTVKTSEEIEKVADRWKSVGLTTGSHDEPALAMVLQTQLEYNETHELPAEFMRQSIPLLVRVFHASEAVRRNNFTNYFEDVAWPQVFTFKEKFPVSRTNDKTPDLDEEAQLTASLAGRIAKELDEAFSDRADTDIMFRGLGVLDDGTILMYYS